MVERSSFGQNSGQKKKPESAQEKNAKPKEAQSSQNSVEQLSPASSPRFGGGATYTNPVTSEHQPPQIHSRQSHNNF